ncbi:hypothetical protein Rhal01_00231 [Rubritalea halochordaticola]|uniref:Uncharacterized protein n=1 Tax=Rubritalea halochordaticola TaxID=714537 RepID=A0ABP9UWJ5_9BACT
MIEIEKCNVPNIRYYFWRVIGVGLMGYEKNSPIEGFGYKMTVTIARSLSSLATDIIRSNLSTSYHSALSTKRNTHHHTPNFSKTNRQNLYIPHQNKNTTKPHDPNGCEAYLILRV